ncbi:hypothetical protein B0H17DRAFT_1190585 [Mycena rosella]|uniref:Uncharacterized protein n=1 Tax=Mycena rosella TaxID=1033263 RepID=A0AAD7H416_MYCRO|nr:hypothetical protein B0H17DRAFT_1190585 [Mycena rosella]
MLVEHLARFTFYSQRLLIRGLEWRVKGSAPLFHLFSRGHCPIRVSWFEDVNPRFSYSFMMFAPHIALLTMLPVAVRLARALAWGPRGSSLPTCAAVIITRRTTAVSAPGFVRSRRAASDFFYDFRRVFTPRAVSLIVPRVIPPSPLVGGFHSPLTKRSLNMWTTRGPAVTVGDGGASPDIKTGGSDTADFGRTISILGERSAPPSFPRSVLVRATLPCLERTIEQAWERDFSLFGLGPDTFSL